MALLQRGTPPKMHTQPTSSFQEMATCSSKATQTSLPRGPLVGVASASRSLHSWSGSRSFSLSLSFLLINTFVCSLDVDGAVPLWRRLLAPTGCQLEPPRDAGGGPDRRLTSAAGRGRKSRRISSRSASTIASWSRPPMCQCRTSNPQCRLVKLGLLGPEHREPAPTLQQSQKLLVQLGLLSQSTAPHQNPNFQNSG